MRKLLATTAIVTMAAMPLYAESHTGGDSSSGQEQASMTSGDLQIRGSELMGKTVYIPGEDGSSDDIEDEVADAPDAWEDAGEIGDIILSGEGELKSVTLDVGGFLGVGEKVVSASMDELKFVQDSDDEGEYFVVFEGDRSELEEREDFDQAAAEQQGDQMMSDQSDSQSASSDQSGQMTTTGGDSDSADSSSSSDMSEDERTTDMGDDDSSSDMSEEETASGSAEQNERSQQTREALSSFTADELEGMPVYGSDGDRVGEVERIILTAEGEVETVVVDVGGFLGLGEKPVAVSLDELLTGEDAESGEMRLSVNHTEEELQDMESWEE